MRPLSQPAAAAFVAAAVAALALALGASPARAVISFGGFDLVNGGFADSVLQMDAGTFSLYGGAADLDDALAGFSPTKGLVNIGEGGNANDFALLFGAVRALNLPGDDLVFFDARFSEDPYEIRVRLESTGTYSAPVSFAAGDFVDTGEAGPEEFGFGSSVYALALDLDDFGLGSHAIVDAVRVSALMNAGGMVQGDPVMVGLLNAVPEPSRILFLALGAASALLRRRRRAVT